MASTNTSIFCGLAVSIARMSASSVDPVVHTSSKIKIRLSCKPWPFFKTNKSSEFFKRDALLKRV